MKIILIHGDYKIKAYERLRKLVDEVRRRNWELTSVEEQTQTIPEIISSQSLFNKNRLVVLKNISKISKKDISWLIKNYLKYDGVLVVYSEGYLNSMLLKSLRNISKIEEYKLPKIIFNLLDSFFPKNSHKIIQLLHKTIKNNPPEFVFSLISKHFRDLYWVNINPKTIPYPSWRIGKLKVQAKKYESSKLKDIIKAMSEIDIEVKTSKADIISSLDLLIATKLQ